MTKKSTQNVILILVIFLGLIWIVLRMEFPNLDTKDPALVFEDMYGTTWPKKAVLVDWYFNNDKEAIAVFHFQGDVSELQKMVQTNDLRDLSANPTDKVNFDDSFRGFKGLNIPNYSQWDKYGGISEKSKNYIYLVINHNNNDAICFANSW